ncbi:MAG TPA: prenyltransferase/squalene oxidase repeat-containing protein [Solirubrobacteraceae bacterium]|nr:prenyltransferase/squalene oxidase repeat-containing protein [Solirubrobacteraceae bacterium]
MKNPLTGARAALVVTLLLSASLLWQATPAGAHVSEAEALTAARKGAQWIALLQELDGELGSFGGDWSMIGLASLGINAADVRAAPGEPSAQDFYLSQWTAEPSLLSVPTDYERAILGGYAGGLEPSRLGARTNLLADLAAFFDGHELGEAGATNTQVFGVLALRAIDGPGDVIETLVQRVREQQHADGGWNFAAAAKTSEADVTGAALAALCAAGVPSSDSAVVKALAYLHTVQDSATGGFVNPKVNTDSTAWVVSGLDTCGIDPQGAEWTTTAGKTPLDFLLAQQNEDGSFQLHPGDESEGLYATQDAVRALSGAGFIVAPPLREGGAPAVRSAPAVAAGTPVPMTLAIDAAGHVTGGSSLRMCKVLAPVGATVAQALADAELSSTPAYCVSDLALEGERIVRLNGVSAEPGTSAWQVSREGGAGEAQAGGTVGLGALVQVRLVPSTQAPVQTPQTPPAPPAQVASPSPRTVVRPRLAVAVLTRVVHGHVSLTVICPRSSAACAGTVQLSLSLPSVHGRLREQVVGRHVVRLAPGGAAAISVALDRQALAALRRHDDRLARIVVLAGTPSSLAASASTVLR